jgi:hypothetical protein
MLSYGYLKEKNEKAQDRVLANQHASYRGSAKVLLSSFYHPPTNEQPRALDRKNVNRLKTIFREQGFRRKDPHNHVPVLLGEEALRLALQRSNVQEKDLINHPADTPPLLELETHSLRYLHGRHRLMAAEDLLVQKDRWWIADIYLDSMASLKEKLPSSSNRGDQLPTEN